MKRNKHLARLLMLMGSALFVVVTAFGVHAATQSESIPLDGMITATITNGQAVNPLRNELDVLIRYAERLIRNTEVSADGTNISADRWWATGTAHTTFQTAINTAQSALDAYDASPAQTLLPSDTFNITVRVDENAGFGSMFVRLSIPQGIEVIGFERHNLPGIAEGFMPPEVSPYAR